MEEWNAVPIVSPWDGMTPVGSHMTTEGTDRRQGQEFMRP
jgi:hypothetical protein